VWIPTPLTVRYPCRILQHTPYTHAVSYSKGGACIKAPIPARYNTPQTHAVSDSSEGCVCVNAPLPEEFPSMLSKMSVSKRLGGTADSSPHLWHEGSEVKGVR
jgi:hypothetical protein